MKNKPAPVDHQSRMAIVDSLASCRIGLSNYLSCRGGMEIAWSSSSAEEAYDKLSSDRPDLLIVDIQLTGQDGLEFIKNLRPLYPGLKILVHTTLREEFYATRCIQAGARGFFHKTQPMGELIPAIRKILGGDVFLSGSSVNRAISNLLRGPSSVATKSPGETLTDRELEVISLMASGDSCQDTADKLHISPRTVQVHRTNIRQKLGLESAARLHAYAVRFFGDPMPRSEQLPPMQDVIAIRRNHSRKATKGAGHSSPVFRHKAVKRNRLKK